MVRQFIMIIMVELGKGADAHNHWCIALLFRTKYLTYCGLMLQYGVIVQVMAYGSAPSH